MDGLNDLPVIFLC